MMTRTSLPWRSTAANTSLRHGRGWHSSESFGWRHGPLAPPQASLTRYARRSKCILIVSASTEKYEAECATSETHRWVALDGPSVPGVCVGITDGDEQNIVPRQCSPSSPARSLQ